MFVRRQTLTLLTNLLQEDYIKWKGGLFFRFAVTLVDEDADLQRYGRWERRVDMESEGGCGV